MWSLFKPKANAAPPWLKQRVEELAHNHTAIVERQRLDQPELFARLPKLRYKNSENPQACESGRPNAPQQLHAYVPRPEQAQVAAKREWEVANAHQAWSTLVEKKLISKPVDSKSAGQAMRKAHLAMERARQPELSNTWEQIGRNLGADFSRAAGIKSDVSRFPAVPAQQMSNFELQKAVLLKHEIALQQNAAPETLSFVAALLQVATGIYSKADLPQNMRAAITQEEDLHTAEATLILRLAEKRFPHASDEHAQREFIIEHINEKYDQKLAVTILRTPIGKSEKYTHDEQLTPADCRQGVAILKDGTRYYPMTGLKPTTNPKLTRDLYLKQKTGFGRLETFITDHLPGQRGAARRHAQTMSNEDLARRFADGVKPPEIDIEAFEAYKEWDKRTNPARLRKGLPSADKVNIRNKFLFLKLDELQALYTANAPDNVSTLHPDKLAQLEEAVTFRRLIESEIDPAHTTTYADRKAIFDNLQATRQIGEALHQDLTAINDKTRTIEQNFRVIDAFNPSNWLPPVPTPDSLTTADEVTEIIGVLQSLEREQSVSDRSLPAKMREVRKDHLASLQSEYMRGIREGNLACIRNAQNHLLACTSSHDRQEAGTTSTTPTTNAARLAAHLSQIVRRSKQDIGSDPIKLSGALTHLGLPQADVEAVMRFDMKALKQQRDMLRKKQLLIISAYDDAGNNVSVHPQSVSRNGVSDQNSSSNDAATLSRQVTLVDELLVALRDIIGLAEGSRSVVVGHANETPGIPDSASWTRLKLAERIEGNLVVIRANSEHPASQIVAP